MQCPYGDLHIYYIQGLVKPEWEQGLGAAFLGNWVEDGFSFLFFQEPAHALVAHLIGPRPELTLLDSYCMPYSQWQHDHDRVQDIGRFSVCAPWVDQAPAPGQTRLWLDPGVVFGTGAHPTTSDCIRALERVYERSCPARVLDLGTGTGLLALAAVSLGAQEATAVDLNPLAAKTAARNAALNAMENRIRVLAASALDFAEAPADIVAANIHCEVMKKLVQTPGFLAGRVFILSGLMRTEIGEIKDLIRQAGARIDKEWEQDATWFTVLGKGP